MTVTGRRTLLALAAAAPLARARAQGGFEAFLAGVRAEALRAGVSGATIAAAFRGVAPDPQVLAADRHQPEFTLTWAEYKARVLPPARLDRAAEQARRQAPLLARVRARFGVDAPVLLGIWGLESDFGQKTGTHREVTALATLAFDGRRARYFRTELINALRILDAGDVSPAGMTGSWAGAMGQPQFMPSSYLASAVDFDGDGRRNIWTSVPDVLGSIANYLARAHWRAGEPWGQPVRLPPGFDASLAGHAQPLGAWERLGVRRIDGRPFSRAEVRGVLVLPDGAGGEAFMTYANFQAIRRYNPSDFYALAVGLLGNASA
jgi:membrane-bound lytic murein transglycosylase B